MGAARHGLCEPVTAILAIAFAALIALGVHGGVAATGAGVAARLLTVLLAPLVSRLAGTLLATGGRRGRDAATLVSALGISTVAVAGTKVHLCLYPRRGDRSARGRRADRRLGHRSAWLRWLAVPVGISGALTLSWRLGEAAVHRLGDRQVEILEQLRSGAGQPAAAQLPAPV